MKNLRTPIAGLALLALLAAPSLASTRNHYHKQDASIEAQAHAILKKANLDQNVTVRSVRGRLVVVGTWNAKKAAKIKAKLAQTDAYSVVVK
ncbi:MAG: hypothetical protein KDB61_06115 [Planctomycetes bacterium]|nr:hypothetical protein [Planctomycetota bacterium]